MKRKKNVRNLSISYRNVGANLRLKNKACVWRKNENQWMLEPIIAARRRTMPNNLIERTTHFSLCLCDQFFTRLMYERWRKNVDDHKKKKEPNGFEMCTYLDSFHRFNRRRYQWHRRARALFAMLISFKRLRFNTRETIMNLFLCEKFTLTPLTPRCIYRFSIW